MSELKTVAVKDLKLDLNNYRTRPQKNEVDAVKAMIGVKPERFYAILESILEPGGYIAAENIVVLKEGVKDDLVVKEGNRRIASLKLIHGFIKLPGLPSYLQEAIDNATPEFKKANLAVPCLVFEKAEKGEADAIVSRVHGKGESAGRDKWNAVATARHGREVKGRPEPALDVLEQFLADSALVNGIQREKWSGDFKLTILNDLLRMLAGHLGLPRVQDVAGMYINGELPPALDHLIFAIGQDALSTDEIRSIDGWNAILAKLGMTKPAASATPGAGGTGTGSGAAGTGAGAGAAARPKKSAAPAPRRAMAIDDPRYVHHLLKKLVIYGDESDKIESLKNEALRLKLDKHSFSFCFVLRSMLELSVRAYCKDYRIPLTEIKDGKKQDRILLKLVAEAKKMIVANLPDDDYKKESKKALDNAYSHLSDPKHFLSVTSLNQLIHSTTLMASEKHIAATFANIFPLLQHLNAPRS